MYCFASICRICLTSNKIDLINLNKSDNDNIKINDKLTFCIPEIFNPFNNLPENICCDCYQFIQRMYEFKQICIDNTILLNKYASKLSNVPGVFKKNSLVVKINRNSEIEELLKDNSVIIIDESFDSSVEIVKDQNLELEVVSELKKINPQLEIQTDPEFELPLSSLLGLQKSLESEIRKSPELEIQISPQSEIQISPQLEIQISPQLEIQKRLEWKIPNSPQLEIPKSPELEISKSPELEILINPESQIQTRKSEIQTIPQSEIQTIPHSEIQIIPQSEIQTIPEPEIKTSPQNGPASLNSSSCSSNDPNSSNTTTSKEISMYSVSLNKWDLFETKYTCRCIKEFSSFTEKTTHLCKNCEGELLGFRLSKIKVGAVENRYNNFPTIKQENEQSDSFDSDLTDFENESNDYELERGFDFNDVLLSKVHINGVKKQIDHLEDNLNDINHSEAKPKLNTNINGNICPICEKIFPTRYFLNNHYLLHTDTELHECDYCGDKFIEKSHLETHQLNHYKTAQENTLPSVKFELDTPTTSKSVTINIDDSDSEEEQNSLSKNSDLNSSNESVACGTCDKIFESKGKLAIHLMTHFGKKEHKCPTCDKEFFRKENFDIHMETHHRMPSPQNEPEVIKYKCPHCNKCFNTVMNVRRHIRETHEIKTYCCSICDEVVNDKEILEQHIFVEHLLDDCKNSNVRRKYMCPNCDKYFTNVSYVRRHMREVHDIKKYTCLICDVTYNDKQLLDDHVIDAHGVRESAIKELQVKHKEPQIKHKETQIKYKEPQVKYKEPQIKYKEPQIKYKEPQIKHKELQIKHKEPQIKHKEPQIKHKEQVSKREIYAEPKKFKQYTMQEDVKHKCPYCSKQYNHTTNVRRHINTHHKLEEVENTTSDDEDDDDDNDDDYNDDDDDDYIDDEYEKKYSIKTEDDKDSEFKLNLLKPFSCDRCEKSFQYLSSLRRHVRDVHEKDDFFCPTCNEAFNDRQTLDEHIFVVHNMMNYDNDDTEQEMKDSSSQESAKKFKCTYCDKRYYHVSNVRRHMKENHSEDKYLCSICNETFIEKRILEAHIFKVHTQAENKNAPDDGDKKKGFPCPVCNKNFNHLSNLRMHALSHSDVQESSPDDYKFCKICKKQIKKNSSMARHMMTHTSGNVNECHVCSAKFDNRWVLRQHMKSKHPDLNDVFQCKDCFKSYSSKVSLLNHRRIHTR